MNWSPNHKVSMWMGHSGPRVLLLPPPSTPISQSECNPVTWDNLEFILNEEGENDLQTQGHTATLRSVEWLAKELRSERTPMMDGIIIMVALTWYPILICPWAHLTVCLQSDYKIKSDHDFYRGKSTSLPTSHNKCPYMVVPSRTSDLQVWRATS